MWWTWVVFSLALIARKIERKGFLDAGIAVLVFCSGAVTSYFDLLFSPAFAPTMIGFLALAVGLRNERKASIPIQNAIMLVIVWFIGFGASWASKWLFSTAILGVDIVWPDLRYAFAKRGLGATNANVHIFSATKEAFATHYGVLTGSILIAAAALIRPLVAGRLLSVYGAHWACLHAPLIIPIAWAELLRNHSIAHPNFAARAFIFFAIIPLLASLWLNQQTAVPPSVRAAGDMPEPGGSKVERRLPIWECAHHPRTPSDLTQDALERIVGADTPPMLLREGIVGQRLFDRSFHELGGSHQTQRPQLLDHSDSLLTRRHDVLAGVDRLEHGRNLPHLGRGHVTEDVTIPVHDAALPSRLGKELRGALGKPEAGIRGD
jgi:hypothetical protein